MFLSFFVFFICFLGILNWVFFFIWLAIVDGKSSDPEQESALAAIYRTERNLRDALKPMYASFFERLNAHPGGLKLLVTLRSNLLSLLA